MRIIVIDRKAFEIRRLVRPGDFRASGSGLIRYSPEDLDERCVQVAFQVAEKLGGDSIAIDFVMNHEAQPWILELSYGFVNEVYDPCAGYWETSMNWYPAELEPQAWMVESVLKSLAKK